MLIITRRRVYNKSEKNNAERLVAHSTPQAGSSRRRWADSVRVLGFTTAARTLTRPSSMRWRSTL